MNKLDELVEVLGESMHGDDLDRLHLAIRADRLAAVENVCEWLEQQPDLEFRHTIAALIRAKYNLGEGLKP